MQGERYLTILPKGTSEATKGGLRLDLAERHIVVARRTARLNAIEMRLLFHLFKYPEETQRNGMLLKIGWPEGRVSSDSLKARIGILRRKIGDDPDNPLYIQTVPTLGYRFIGRVKHPDKEGTLSRKELEILEAIHVIEHKAVDTRWNLLFPPLVLSYCLDKFRKYLDTKERDTLPIFSCDAQITIMDANGKIKTHPSTSAKMEDARRHKGEILWSGFNSEIKNEPFRAIAKTTEKQGWISWADSGYSLVYPPIYPRDNYRICVAYFRKEDSDVFILEMHQELVTELDSEIKENLPNILPERIREAERYL